MKILALDIETSPNLVYTWGLFDQNVSLSQIVSTTRVMCFAASWIGDDKGEYPYGQKPKKDGTVFYSDPVGDDPCSMLTAAHLMLSEADVAMHYNGRSFDIPHLQREFLEHNYEPPKPFADLDLFLTVRKMFKFPSRKLQHVSDALGLEGKIETGGFDLWTKCMAGDPKAWKMMEKYNRQDVALLEELYGILLPWIPAHPNVVVHNGSGTCPKCGSDDVGRRGYAHTRTASYPQFQCRSCSGWFRGGVKVHREVGR